MCNKHTIAYAICIESYYVLKVMMFMKIRRAFSLVLCAALMICALPLSGITASALASDFTAEQGAQWARDRANERWAGNVDNAYGSQCVDLIMAYYTYLVGYRVAGNGYDYKNNSLPSGWQRVYSDPHIGDVIVWDQYVLSSKSKYGHVGIVVAVNGNTLTTVEDNGNGGNSATATPSPTNYYTRYADKATCFIRPNFKASAPPPEWYEGLTPVDLGEWFVAEIENKTAGKLLVNDGSNVAASDRSDIIDRQNWIFNRLDDGSYSIVSAVDLSSSMDITDFGKVNGTNVQLMPWVDNDAQRFFIYDVNGSYFIRPKCSVCVLDVDKETDNLSTWNFDPSYTQKQFSVNKVGYDPFPGSGTEEDPYHIDDKGDLERLRDLINSRIMSAGFRYRSYIQRFDIDLEGERWTPIGKRFIDGQFTDCYFSGHYDGGCHLITGLNVSEIDRYAGLFGSTGHTAALIENLAVEGGVFSSGDFVGGIVGELCTHDACVKNCCFIGDVSGDGGAVGGIVGNVWESVSIIDCYHIGSVSTLPGNTLGGIAGRITVSDSIPDIHTLIENCYHVGALNGDDTYKGTIVGAIMRGNNTSAVFEIKNCYALQSDGKTIGSGSANTSEAAAIKPELLKMAASSLGEAYTDDTPDLSNEGYPIFAWQAERYVEPEPERLLGDLDDDRSITASDALAILRISVGVKEASFENFLVSDVDFDYEITSSDALNVLRYSVGMSAADGIGEEITN